MLCTFISNDETLAATFSSRNTVYIHSLETKKQILKFKSLSNISYVAISNNLQKIAVKNTSGVLALHDIKTGAELSRNQMFKTEGEQIFFQMMINMFLTLTGVDGLCFSTALMVPVFCWIIKK